MFSQGKRAVHPASGVGLELGLRQLADGGDHLALFGADVEVHCPAIPCAAASLAATPPLAIAAGMLPIGSILDWNMYARRWSGAGRDGRAQICLDRGVEQSLASVGYIPSRQIATAVYLAQHLEKPILVEGPAGVGKTELAKSVATCLELPLIRMQCYEGLDEAKALYEWKYGKQLLYTQILKDKIGDVLGSEETLPSALDKLHAIRRRFFLAAVPRASAIAARVAAARRRGAADRRDR